MDSLGGTREAPGRQERTIGQPGRHQGGSRGRKGAWEAPGKQERTYWTAWEAPGRQEEPFGQPGRHQGSTREAGKDLLDSSGGIREAPGRQNTPSTPHRPFRVQTLGFRVIQYTSINYKRRLRMHPLCKDTSAGRSTKLTLRAHLVRLLHLNSFRCPALSVRVALAMFRAPKRRGQHRSLPG